VSGRAPSGIAGASASLIGRDDELQRLLRWVCEPGPACLTLVGDPGIGKTSLWEAGLELATVQGYDVLVARTSEVETGLTFAALADLVDAARPEALADLPPPQHYALEVALRRAGPAEAAPEPFAIAAGLLSLVRSLSEHRRLLVAIDDVQWLDRASAGVLVYAARRLASGQVRFLLSRRPGRRPGLERALEPAGVEQADLGALSLGAVSRLLVERLGLALPRRVLRQVYETSAGNPLIAIELGRLLQLQTPEVGADLPLPDLAEDIFGPRLEGLPERLRRPLLAVSLSAGLSAAELAKLVGPLSVEDAHAAGLIMVQGLRARPAHPLLAAAARRMAPASERRQLHLELAAAVADPTLRAKHLAMAALGPDSELAAELAELARAESQRGAVQDAEELAAHALRLTFLDDAERPARLLELARYHLSSGDVPRATDLLNAHLDDLARGRDRARAYLMLGECADVTGEARYVQQALAEAGDDAELRALALARKATILAVDRVEDISEAEDLAEQAMNAARLAGPQVVHQVRPALAWARILQGHAIDELVADAAPEAHGLHPYEGWVDRTVGIHAAFRGELGTARRLFQRLLAVADQRGEVRSALVLNVQLCELELRAGDVLAAGVVLEAVEQWSALEEFAQCRARLGAMRAAVAGDVAEAGRLAASVLKDPAGREPSAWDRLEAERALGLARLLGHDAPGAAELLQGVWEHTLRHHVDDPGAFPVAPDLVEALLAAGEEQGAREVARVLAQRSERLAHPWGLVTAERCRALVELAGDYREQAAEALEGAARSYQAMGAGFDQARSLLALGRAGRRHKKRSVARQALESAAGTFERMACPGWAGEAREELARVSGRRSAAEDELTPSERKVAELAGSGLSNKEIAGQLFVSVYTVEAHLSHAYAKLGVRSRSQLAGRLGGAG